MGTSDNWTDPLRVELPYTLQVARYDEELLYGEKFHIHPYTKWIWTTNHPVDKHVCCRRSLDSPYFSMRRPWTDVGGIQDQNFSIQERSSGVRVSSFWLVSETEMVEYKHLVKSFSSNKIYIIYSIDWLEICAAKCFNLNRCVLFRLVFSSDVSFCWCVFFKTAQ
ncbi:hypothetical protein LSH36_1046g00041 [Paralvinella palmiformis]|uniref:Uncharacterized protein n=1 Tax=Paralvinella palmiformis TaxID=53620 RepID=A0AAD9MS26_9ANNE|nr:hypothetical protein LSH36_1046g00041 [Paralvinella palmiformis]